MQFQSRKVKMQKIPLAPSLKEELRSLKKSPGVPHRTDKELEVTSSLANVTVPSLHNRNRTR